MLGARFRVQGLDSQCWVLGSGFWDWVVSAGFWVQGQGSKFSGFRDRVLSMGCHMCQN